MAEATQTCAEVLDRAERDRRRVLALYDGKQLERELKRADEQVERARNRHDCI